MGYDFVEEEASWAGYPNRFKVVSLLTKEAPVSKDKTVLARFNCPDIICQSCTYKVDLQLAQEITLWSG